MITQHHNHLSSSFSSLLFSFHLISPMVKKNDIGNKMFTTKGHFPMASAPAPTTTLAPLFQLRSAPLPLPTDLFGIFCTILPTSPLFSSIPFCFFYDFDLFNFSCFFNGVERKNEQRKSEMKEKRESERYSNSKL